MCAQTWGTDAEQSAATGMDSRDLTCSLGLGTGVISYVGLQAGHCV